MVGHMHVLPTGKIPALLLRPLAQPAEHAGGCFRRLHAHVVKRGLRMRMLHR